MALILSLLFNDYGLPSGKAWIFFAIMICIIAVFSMVFDEDADGLPSYLISGFGLALYLVLFFAIASINQTYQWYGYSKDQFEKMHSWENHYTRKHRGYYD